MNVNMPSGGLWNVSAQNKKQVPPAKGSDDSIDVRARLFHRPGKPPRTDTFRLSEEAFRNRNLFEPAETQSGTSGDGFLVFETVRLEKLVSKEEFDRAFERDSYEYDFRSEFEAGAKAGVSRLETYERLYSRMRSLRDSGEWSSEKFDFNVEQIDRLFDDMLKFSGIAIQGALASASAYSYETAFPGGITGEQVYGDIKQIYGNIREHIKAGGTWTLVRQNGSTLLLHRWFIEVMATAARGGRLTFTCHFFSICFPVGSLPHSHLMPMNSQTCTKNSTSLKEVSKAKKANDSNGAMRHFAMCHKKTLISKAFASLFQRGGMLCLG